jgi:hypothetical protein
MLEILFSLSQCRLYTESHDKQRQKADDAELNDQCRRVSMAAIAARTRLNFFVFISHSLYLRAACSRSTYKVKAGGPASRTKM